MQVSDFSFELPEHLIAKHPTAVRSSSRLLHLDVASGAITHYQFNELPSLLDPEDLLVFNNTRVIPARLFGKKETGGKVEILLERLLSTHLAKAQIRSSKTPKPGSEILLDTNGVDNSSVRVQVVGRDGSFFNIQFPDPGVSAIAGELGHMPLPPYIDREDQIEDRERYQTIYASREGAVAAPTSGLHFDEELFTTLEQKGIRKTEVTLHVGAGTFQPVRVEKVEDHEMHSEWLDVPETTCDAVANCREKKGRVVAIGTTCVRSLESASARGQLAPFQGDTNIFIYPGYEFKSVDAMVTNFHLPGSTLIMLVSAFAGSENIRRAYEIAIQESYRFFSYGDAMLITR